MNLIAIGEMLPDEDVGSAVGTILVRFTYEILNSKSEEIEDVIKNGKFTNSEQRRQLIGLICTAIDELAIAELAELARKLTL